MDASIKPALGRDKGRILNSANVFFILSFLAPFILLSDLFLLLRREIVLDIKRSKKVFVICNNVIIRIPTFLFLQVSCPKEEQVKNVQIHILKITLIIFATVLHVRSNNPLMSR